MKLFIFLLILFTWINFSSQTIQLGTGVAETTATTSSPVNIWYRRFVSQFVYTSAEITSAGVSSAGLITHLGFYVSEAPVYSIPGYTIKIKHTSSTDVLNAQTTTGWTEVVNSFTYLPTEGGFDMIELDTPFFWDGTSNIAVEICCSQVLPSYDESGKCRYYSTSNGYRYSWTDAAGTSCGSTAGSVTDFKPQCQMIFPEQTNWTGDISTDWFDNANWSAGIPNKYKKVYIPNGLINYPSISATSAVCDDITIDGGGSLIITGSNTLDVYGNWTNNGSFTCNSSTVNFFGSNLTSMNGLNNQVFYNLKNSNPSGLNMSSGSYDIKGSLYPEGGTITTNNSLRILSNAAGTGRIGEVKSFCEYTLNMLDSYGDGWNGGFITVSNDGEIIGSFSAADFGSISNFNVLSGSTFEISYTSGDWEGENEFNLLDSYGSVVFSAGPNIPTGLIYTGAGDCSGVDPFDGDVTVQRYLSLVNDGWRELTTPMPGKTLLDWQDDGLIMANFPGSNFPNFGWTSVYSYEENNADGIKENGWLAASNITNALSADNGHRVYIGTGNFTVNVQGDVNVGDYNINLDYQNLLPNEISADENEKGWNLIGNPYPGTLSWDKISDSRMINMDDAFWMWSGDAGNYGTYLGDAGSGTNGVGPSIASSQAFWVHASAAGASLTTREIDKEDIDHPFVKNGIEASYFSLKLTSNFNTFSDEILITYRDYFSSQLDQYDALKLQTPVAQAPNMYGSIGNEKIGICSASTVEGLELPIVADVHNTGYYTLEVSQFENISTNCIVLDDLLTGQSHLIDSNFSMLFQIQANDLSARFVLRTFNNVLVEIQNESCYLADDAAVNIIGGGANQSDYIFTNTNTGSVQTVNPIVWPWLTNITPGTYELSNTPIAQCPTFSQIILVESAEEILLNHTSTNATCPNCADGSFELVVTGGVPPYQFVYDNFANDSLNQLSVGEYLYSVTDAKGCSITNSFEITSDDTSIGMEELSNQIKVYPNPAYNLINFQNLNVMDTEIYVYNNLGRLVKKDNTSGNTLDVSDLSSGLYWLIIPNYHSKPIVFEVLK